MRGNTDVKPEMMMMIAVEGFTIVSISWWLMTRISPSGGYLKDFVGPFGWRKDTSTFSESGIDLVMHPSHHDPS